MTLVELYAEFRENGMAELEVTDGGWVREPLHVNDFASRGLYEYKPGSDITLTIKLRDTS